MEIDISQNYEDCRQDFLNDVTRLEGNSEIIKKFEVERLRYVVPAQNPLNIDASAKCENTIDGVFLRRRSDDKKGTSDQLGGRSTTSHLVVLTSGVHGIEAPIGSFIQRQLLAKLTKEVGQIPDPPSFLILHALNPWGFRHGRRTTETNVNLNRNFLDNFSKMTKAHIDKAYPSDVFESKGAVKNLHLARAKLILNLNLEFIKRWGRKSSLIKIFRELNQKLSQGQYWYPRGLEFGGFSAEPQVEWLSGVFSKLKKEYQSVWALDIHTGLGDSGTMHLIPSSNCRCRPWDFTGPYQWTSRESEGFYETYGGFTDFIVQNFGPETTALTVEFGTLGSTVPQKLDTFFRVLIENQSYQWGCETKEIDQKVKRLFSEAFFPSDVVWRKKVCDAGLWLIELVMNNEKV